MATIVSETEIRLLARLARALHIYGSPSHRVEESLNAIASTLEVEAQFLVTPTSIVASVGHEGDGHTFLERVDPGDAHLEKLAQLNQVIKALLSNEISAAEALLEVDRIIDAPNRWGAATTIAAFSIASGSASVLFGGRVTEILLSGVLGLLIGVLAMLLGRQPRLGSIFPALAAIVAAALPLAALPHVDHLPFIPTLAGLIVLVPGLSLTIAINELAHRHLVSGTAQLTAAILTFLLIGLGVAVGTELATPLAQGLQGTAPEPPPWPWQLAALGAAAAAFVVLFRARPRDLPTIVLAALIAFGTARTASSIHGPEIGAALGAFCLGAYSNVLARWRYQPAAIPLLPGLLLLVPGSVGFQSLSSLIQNDVLTGIETGFTMMLTAVSLVTGLFLANLILPSRRLL